MANKKDKDVKVKSFIRNGKRVKPYTRRQKVRDAAIVTGGVVGAGLTLATLAKRGQLKKLANKSKSKLVPIISPNAQIPPHYNLDPTNVTFGPPNGNAKLRGLENIRELMDEDSFKIASFAGRQNQFGRQDLPGLYIPFINKKTGKTNTLIKISSFTGESDLVGRPIDAILTFVLPEDIDPRGLNLEAFRKKLKSSKIKQAIVDDEIKFRGEEVDEKRFDEIQDIYREFISKGIESRGQTSQSQLVNFRDEYNKRFNKNG